MSLSIQRLRTLIRKETIQLLRDRRTLGIMLALPVIVLFLFAYAVSLTIDHIPTAVADLSMDARSQDFIDALSVSGFYDMDLYAQDEEEVIRAIEEGKVRAGVVIPPGFAGQGRRHEEGMASCIDVVAKHFTQQLRHVGVRSVHLIDHEKMAQQGGSAHMAVVHRQG